MTLGTPTGDIVGIIELAIDEFTERTGFVCTAEARSALIDPAMDDMEHISGEIESGRITPRDVIDAGFQQLSQARDNAQQEGRSELLAEDIYVSMKIKCWFRPWC